MKKRGKGVSAVALSLAVVLLLGVWLVPPAVTLEGEEPVLPPGSDLIDPQSTPKEEPLEIPLETGQVPAEQPPLEPSKPSQEPPQEEPVVPNEPEPSRVPDEPSTPNPSEEETPAPSVNVTPPPTEKPSPLPMGQPADPLEENDLPKSPSAPEPELPQPVPEDEPPQEPLESEDIGEPWDQGDAWQELLDSDFFTYWQDQIENEEEEPEQIVEPGLLSVAEPPVAYSVGGTNCQQILSPGGTEENESDGVSVSKTIAPTNLENVFDITLQVDTTSAVSSVLLEPDIAVVLVVDTSNSMKNSIGNTKQTRSEAAITAAEKFIDLFTTQASENSCIGYVAFNTNAHEVFSLQTCNSSQTALRLKNTLRTKTQQIFNEMSRNSSYTFTNIEGGLKRAKDMLSNSSLSNQYIVFLSDGFPTTYLKSGYTGYSGGSDRGKPGSDGVFYDAVSKKYCSTGNNYSDKGAIRAEAMAKSVKEQNIEVFSVGVDIGGQTISQYIAEETNRSSRVDRTSTTYAIGGESDSEAYKTWLKEKIGSGKGHYFDSTDSEGLLTAYTNIFSLIDSSATAAAQAAWVTEDPIPSLSGSRFVEFIGFFDKTGALSSDDLTGTAGENHATFSQEDQQIRWDLKQSGFTSSSEDNITHYHYQMTYRVRLKNEVTGFAEGEAYNTNDTTKLTYRIVTETNGQTTISDNRTLVFPVPSVLGYLADFQFQKQDQNGDGVSGAVFTLSHDTTRCTLCHGDKTAVSDLGPYYATSTAEGTVTFSNLPSGHKYLLKETGIPEGYTLENDDEYWITVAYDTVSIMVKHSDQSQELWPEETPLRIVNVLPPSLPNTGGPGFLPFLCGGGALTTAGLALRRKNRKSPRKTNRPKSHEKES